MRNFNENNNIRGIKEQKNEQLYLLKKCERVEDYFFVNHGRVFEAPILKIALGNSMVYCCDDSGNLKEFSSLLSKKPFSKKHDMIGTRDEPNILRQKSTERHFESYRIRTVTCTDNYLFVSFEGGVLKQYN